MGTFVEEKVDEYYREHNYNCATTSLLTLGDFFNIQLQPQVIDSALGMHGAGKFGAQCGLVEGALLFIGIWGRHTGLKDGETVALCREFAKQFETRFSSLQCSELRPEGFRKDQLPHLCRDLTVEAIQFSLDYLKTVRGDLL